MNPKLAALPQYYGLLRLEPSADGVLVPVEYSVGTDESVRTLLDDGFTVAFCVLPGATLEVACRNLAGLLEWPTKPFAPLLRDAKPHPWFAREVGRQAPRTPRPYVLPNGSTLDLRTVVSFGGRVGSGRNFIVITQRDGSQVITPLTGDEYEALGAAWRALDAR